MESGRRGEPSAARSAAHAILLRVSALEAKPDDLLHSPAVSTLSRADRDLVTELVYGVNRWRGLLDFVIEAHARRPVANLDAPLLEALRLGVYQLRFLSRVPARAAVDESVKLAHVHGSRGGPGLVNAVLRSVTRRPDFPALPRRDASPLEYLTIALSHPRWLAGRYLERLGLPEAEALCLRNNHPPPLVLRVDGRSDPNEVLSSLALEGVGVEPYPFVPGALRVTSGDVIGSKIYRSGRVYLQDAGSQLIACLVAPAPRDLVLDACAAPGGKTISLASTHPNARIVAVEVGADRARRLRSAVKKARLENALSVRADASQLPFTCHFNRILLDAPCSGLGTLSRNPDIKWRLSEDDLKAHASRQLSLLESCARLTAPGGRLVYATCSTEPEENEDVLRSFLSLHPEFGTAPPPASLDPEAKALVGASGALKTRPVQNEMDGYYAVILERRVS